MIADQLPNLAERAHLDAVDFAFSNSHLSSAMEFLVTGIYSNILWFLQATITKFQQQFRLEAHILGVMGKK
jgi:hypothetical protein